MQTAPSSDTLDTEFACLLKKGDFCCFLTVFENQVRHLRPPFRAATVEFLVQNLCDCPLHAQVSSIKLSAESGAPRQSCEFWSFRPCLLACLLLLAKPHRSTLDTKEGDKTKTASTTSVTPTLT